MRDALLIFRKDVRRLWPLVALNGFLFDSVAAGDVATIFNTKTAVPLLFMQLPAILCPLFLIAALIQQEKLTGDRAYWFTRPFSWRNVLAAKLLFAVVLVSLPLLMAQVTALLGTGLSPFAYAGMLLREQVRFFIVPVIEIFALAAVTRGMVEFIWVTLLCMVAQLIGLLIFLTVFNPAEAQDWPRFEWFRSAVLAAFALLFAAAILLLQYAGRRTTLARATLAAAVIALAWARVLAPWHVGFDLARRWSGYAVDPVIGQVSYSPHPNLMHGGACWFERPGTFLFIPIDVKGIPENLAVFSERTAARIETSDGRAWNSGWQAVGQILPSSPGGSCLHKPLSNGPGWLNFNLPRRFRLQPTERLHIRASVAFTLLGPVQTATLPISTHMRWISGVGFCAALVGEPPVVAECIAPLEERAYTVLRTQPPVGPPCSEDLLSNSVMSSGIGIWRFSGGGGTCATQGQIYLDSRQPIAYFERELDISGIRLADLEYQRP
jgi:hypothetical protein